MVAMNSGINGQQFPSSLFQTPEFYEGPFADETQAESEYLNVP